MQCVGLLALDVFLPEHVPQLGGGDLATEFVHKVVGDGAELALHVLWQFDAELAFQQVGDTAFAALAVHADDLAVFTADVGGIDAEVGHIPDGLVRFITGEPLLDRVLMTAAEGGEDQFAAVRMTRGDGHASGALIHVDEAAHVAEIQAG